MLEYRGDAQESLTDTINNGGRIECELQPQPMVLVWLPVGSGNNRSPDSTARALAGIGMRLALPLWSAVKPVCVGCKREPERVRFR